MFNRSSRYLEVELKATITSDWLSSERDKGWSGGAKVMGKLSVSGRPT